MLDRTLPKSIDIGRLGSAGARFEGSASLAAMRRLRELVITPESEARATVEVLLDEALCATVTGVVTAQPRLECQRCLEPKELLLRAPFRLLVVNSVAEAEALAGDNDPLVAPGGVVDLLTALEDELLLALPPVAMHEREEVCVQNGFRGGAPEATDGTHYRQNPFAVLAQLKRKGD